MTTLNHIQYLIDNYSIQLQSRLKEEESDITIDQAIDVLLACDPSEGKKLTDWLVKTYCSSGFLWEDVEIGAESKLAEVLGLYQIHFSEIPKDQRNIYDCNSYGELYTRVKPYILQENIDNTPGSKEIRRRERARALDESEVLFRSEAIIIAVPLTRLAAVWWGKGTKWCTAADRNNVFDRYHQKAPLIVITLLNPGSSRGEAQKFQLWMNRREIQFMDAVDNAVNKEMVPKHWNLLGPFIRSLIEVNGIVLQFVPDQFKTKELCMQAIEQNGSVIQYVPSKFINIEFCIKAVESSWQALRYIPINYITAELCAFSVEISGLALAYVPRKFKTVGLCTRAVEKHASAFMHVPEETVTLEICKRAIEKNGSMIVRIPLKYQTPELFMLAVKQTGIALTYVPSELKTKELCWEAVKQYGLALNCVPDEMRTKEICDLAIEQNACAVIYFPEEFQNYELHKNSVRLNGVTIYHVPDKYKTFETLRLAVEQTADALEYIPDKFITNDLLRLAVEKWGRLDNFSEKFLTPELIKLAESYVPEEKQVEWDQSLLSNLKVRINEHFEDKSNEIPKSYPIHNR